MKPICASFLLYILLSLPVCAQAIKKDTLIRLGNNQLHFTIIPGKGMPILFEAGGANDGNTWTNILPAISKITGAPLITYDRPGFGKSSLDSTNHDIVSTIKALEGALMQLHFANQPILLVGHSLGGFYAGLYAKRHPADVKAMVLLDANVMEFYTPSRKAYYAQTDDIEAENWKEKNAGVYYIFKDFLHTLEVMSESPLPTSIPVTDIVSDKTPFHEAKDSVAWKTAHIAFVNASANRKSIIATGAGHFVHIDNPDLTIIAICEQYTQVVTPPEQREILRRLNVWKKMYE